MLAGQTGMTPAQIQATERQNPAGYAALVSGSVMQFIQQLPGMTPAMLADLQAMVQQAGGASVKNQPALQQAVANQFLDKYQASTAGMDLNVWAQFLSQVSNVPLNAGNVMQYIVMQVSGATFGAAAATGAGAAGSSGGMGAASAGGGAGTVSAATAAAHGAGGAATGRYGLAQPVGATGVKGSILGSIEQTLKGSLPFGLGRLIPGGTTHGAQSWQQVLTGGPQGAAAKTYLGQEKKTGQRSPVLEGLMQNVPAGTQVAVQTSSGTRMMSFAQAMQYYPDELEAGNVQFYSSSGQNLGSTGQMTQGLVDPSALAGAAAEQAAKGGSNIGTPMAQFLKQHPQAGTASAVSSGGVTVDLTTEARQLLKLLPTNSDNAAAAATVPSNPNAVAASR
jgi:hypothetical protein